MQIRTKSNVLLAVAALQFLVVCVLLLATQREVRHHLEMEEAASAILLGVLDLNLLANEYTGDNVKRLSYQWDVRYERLAAQTKDFASLYGDRQLLVRLQEEIENADSLFHRFVDLTKSDQSDGNIILAQRYLRTHFNVVLHEVAANAETLSRLVGLMVEKRERERNQTLFAVLGSAVLFMLFWVYFLNRSLRIPLSALARGVRRFSQGDLNHRIPIIYANNEITSLGESFNDMAQRLDAITVSRDTLAEEVIRRREAEAALLRLQRLSYQATEDERARIGRELHDGVIQSISALVLQLESLNDDSGPVSAAAVANHAQRLRLLTEDIRRITHDLHPAMLEDLGLHAALQWLCRETGQSTSGLDIVLDLPDRESFLPLDLRATLFRIAQEALANAVRHSGATRVDIQLTCEDGVVELSVEDNGKGFSSDAFGQGIGLSNLRERTRAFGGDFHLDSRTGTFIAVSFFF